MDYSGVMNVSGVGDPRFDFNVGSYYRRYGGKGVPLCDLEEALWDGLSEAYCRMESGREDSFLGYAVGFVRKAVCRRFRDRRRGGVCFSDFSELVGDDDGFDVDRVVYGTGVSDLIDAGVLARFGERMLDVFGLAYPAPDEKLIERAVGDGGRVNHYRHVPVDRYGLRMLELRYVHGMKFREIADVMGFRSGSWASHYFRRVYDEFLRRCRDVGVLARIESLLIGGAV